MKTTQTSKKKRVSTQSGMTYTGSAVEVGIQLPLNGEPRATFSRFAETKISKNDLLIFL